MSNFLTGDFDAVAQLSRGGESFAGYDSPE
jgi:hypothetical protein